MSVTYSDIDKASFVLLVGFEPEDESPIVFLRLRKAVRKGLKVATVAPLASRSTAKLSAMLIPTKPGSEAEALAALSSDVRSALGKNGLILVGERLAQSAGAYSSVLSLAKQTGAKLAWIPRRAGERGALEAGALGALLPGGRPVADAEARVDVATAWGVSGLPTEVGRSTDGIIKAVNDGELGSLIVGGVDPYDLLDPSAMLLALDKAFVVSLELRPSAVTERADVIFPISPVTEKSGTFLDWEGRARAFAQVLSNSTSISDFRVLTMLAEAMGVSLGVASVEQARSEMAALAGWDGQRITAPTISGGAATGVRLATWRQLLDLGSLQDNEIHLAGTARASVARVSPATATAHGLHHGGVIEVSTDRGVISLPLEVVDMVDETVWIPANSTGSQVSRTLGVGHGAVVSVKAGA